MSIEMFKDQEWFQKMASNLKHLEPRNRTLAIEFIEKLLVDQDYHQYYTEDCAQ